MALLLAICILSPGLSSTAKAVNGPKVFDLIEITDFHGTLEDSSNRPVAGVLAQNINDIKAVNSSRTLVIGAGDLYQGSPISNTLTGVPVQKALSAMGMEVTTVGNHEFDWGLDTITSTTMKDASYSIACANLYDKTTGKRVFEPYKIIEKDGVKIGIIGAVTTEAPTIVLPKYVENYEFKDIATEINTLVPEVKAKADVVIALIHEGDKGDGKTGPIFDIAGKLKGVDALFGGHSHTILNTTVNGMPVYIANNAGKGFIHSTMTVAADGKVSFAGEYVDIYTDKSNGYKAANPVVDANVKAIVDAAKAEVGPIFNEIIGAASQELNRTQMGAPYGESYLGNWNTDVMKSKAGADVAMQNNGGLRIDIPQGDITVGTIFSFMPFDIELCVFNMTKAQIKVVLEQAFMDGGKGIQIAGLKVSYDSARPSGSRVVDITRENGAAISDTEKLKVVTNDFLATGGDGFKGFVDAGTYENTHVLVRDALIENIKANHTITAAMNSRIANLAKYINVVATSDVHGTVYPWDYFGNKASDMGLAKVSTYVNSLRAVNPNLMLIDNGDTIQGTPLVTYYNLIDKTTKYPMMAVMGAMKYDVWTLGNHEFNFALETLGRIINDGKASGIHVLSANTYKADNTNYVEPYYIKDFNVNGKTIKVAVIGLTTKCVPNWDGPANYAGLHFNDLVDEAKKWVKVVKDNGADVVILSAHSGEKGAADIIPENQVTDIAKNVSGIDVIVAGHAHSLLNDLSLINPPPPLYL